MRILPSPENNPLLLVAPLWALLAIASLFLRIPLSMLPFGNPAQSYENLPSLRCAWEEYFLVLFVLALTTGPCLVMPLR